MSRPARAALLTAVAATVLTLTPGLADAQSGTGLRWTATTKVRTVTDARIDEASGLARSTYARPVLFVHNDSGDSARFFALGAAGRTRAVFTLPGAPSLDWEDVASGPGHTLWFGDIGDNRLRKPHVSVIRVHEPRKLGSRDLASTTFRLTFPGGPHNAEALMVQPRTGRVYVISKAKTGARIYRAPATLSPDADNVLTAVARAPKTVTGGDFAPDGKTFVLRGYGKAYLYHRLGGTPRVIDLPSQKQGESIGFNRNGSALLVGSEGLSQPIWKIAR